MRDAEVREESWIRIFFLEGEERFMMSDIVDTILLGERASKGDGLYALLGCSRNATVGFRLDVV